MWVVKAKALTSIVHEISICYCPFTAIHDLKTDNAFFEACGIGSNCQPRKLKFKMTELKIHSITKSPAYTHIHDKMSF